MKTPKIFASRTVAVHEQARHGKLQSTYWLTGLILPMDPAPYVNVSPSLRLGGLTEEERLERLEAFYVTNQDLSHTVYAALRAGKHGGILHPGIDRVTLLGETATIISRTDDETTTARTELAVNLERAVGGFTLGRILVLPQEAHGRL